MKVYAHTMAGKFGLALSGGGARGFAHIGVLRALGRRWQPDFIAATSMGAVVAAIYAARLDVDWVEKVARDFARRSLRLLWDWKLAVGGLLSGRRIEEFLRGYLGDMQFRDLKIPIAVTATDIQRGAAITIREGDVVSALRASFSIPGLLAPVWRRVGQEELLLVDGGVSDPLPVDLLHREGCGAVLAVSANPDYTRPSIDPRRLPTTEITMRSFYVMQKFISVPNLRPQDMVIELNLEDCPFLDFKRIDFLMEQGSLQIREALPILEARLRGAPARKAPFWKQLLERLKGIGTGRTRP